MKNQLVFGLAACTKTAVRWLWVARPSKTTDVANCPLGRVSPTSHPFAAHGQADAFSPSEVCLAVPPVLQRTLLVGLVALCAHCGGNVLVETCEDGNCVMPEAVGSAPGVEQTSASTCEMAAVDQANNRFVGICDEQGCDCYFNDVLRCSCSARRGTHTTCSNGIPFCCQSFPFGDIEPAK